jgi:2-polyprenyl-6-methoxyphenol hydroxylase-like FAD-dependent oxidoreductase
VISRESFMQAFWKNLPQEAREKTHANKRVSSIRTTNDGVVVECADGTSYEGTMVIGADGAYSAVRAQMRRLALEEQERTRSAVSVEAEKPFLTSYRCFWIRFPVLPGLVVGDAVETHGPIITTQFFVGEDSSLLGIYEKLDKSTDSPTRWTQADEAPFVERWRNLPLTKEGRLTLGQAYDHRVAAGWINLEEGVAKYWSHGGRMVLVGDAAHKFTPSTGAGCNEGIVDVVVLTNQLNRAFSTGVPTAETLAEAFRKYQETRFDLVTFGCQLAGRTTNVATWSNTWMKLFDLWIFSIKPIQRFFINLGVKDTARTPVFEWIEGEELIVGNEPWVHAIPKRLM